VISLYPPSFDVLRAWATENGVAVAEARVRFAQYAILRAIASSRVLSSSLVFKGGNALDFVWQPNRSTRDLDFSMDMEAFGDRPVPATLREVFEPALGLSGRALGVLLQLYKVDQRPPGEDKTFVTFRLSVGYALQDEIALRRRMATGVASNNAIPLDISLNEPLLADEAVSIHGTYRLRVSTIEDIVAEKLRAYLQQGIRERVRSQDLLDIAVMIKTHPSLERDRVSRFLLEKAKAREVPVSHHAFLDDSLASRARQNYEALQATTRVMFIPYEEALQSLRDFVLSLEIPD
jgi:predicted nucleotidyltransferase component of viral defense system